MKGEEEWDGEVLRGFSGKWAERVIFFEECGSTNDEGRRLGLGGAGHLTVVLTERQARGRGRRGQAWHCPPGLGIACSLVVRPREAAALWSRHALAAGLGVAEGLGLVGVDAELKWPNDVWVGERKIAGILVEAEGDFVVVGFGVNVGVEEFPEGLAQPATSVILETGRRVRREEVLVGCLERLEVRLGQIGRGFGEMLGAWSERCVLTGRVVSLDGGGVRKRGRVEGVSASGELLLRTERGLERVMQANEIRVVG